MLNQNQTGAFLRLTAKRHGRYNAVDRQTRDVFAWRQWYSVGCHSDFAALPCYRHRVSFSNCILTTSITINLDGNRLCDCACRDGLASFGQFRFATKYRLEQVHRLWPGPGSALKGRFHNCLRVWLVTLRGFDHNCICSVQNDNVQQQKRALTCDLQTYF